jgi:glycosyltransferase involved in cell wall biosynthesis
MQGKEIQKFTGKNVSREAPSVSIITPAYDISRYISETLDSVLAQTFTDFEIILINDGSPDTVEFETAIGPYTDDVVYLKQPNAGAGAARNVAIGHARGEFLAFLDGDDVWLPDFLESQVAFLTESRYDMVYCDAALFGMPAVEGRTFMQTAPSDGVVTFNSILDFSCNVITSGTVARRQAVVDAGMFEWERVRAHDFHLWLRMLKNNSRIGYQRKVLLKYRAHLDSLSGDSISRVQREIDVFKRVRESIELDSAASEIVGRQIEGLEADLEIERGKSFLLGKDFPAAKTAFENANRSKRSFKLRLIAALAGFAPGLLLKFYKSRRAREIAFVPNSEK